MTFAEYYLQLSRNVWPEGEARNLRTLHRTWAVAGLIDLQKKVECLQSKNIERIAHNATYFFCGASAFSAPTGFIKSLRTIPNLLETTNWRQCDTVWAEPLSRQVFECKLEGAAQCGEGPFRTPGQGCYPIYMPYAYYDYEGVQYQYPELDFGLMFPDARTDKSCRARERWFAMWNCYIYTYPVIQSDELILLEWQGIKKTWNDDDIIPYTDESGAVDAQVTEALEHYLLTEKAKRDDCDDARTALMRTEYNRMVSDLIWQCREEGTVPDREHCFTDCACP